MQYLTGFGPHTAGSIANEGPIRSYILQEIYSVAIEANSTGFTAWVDEQTSDYGQFSIKNIYRTYNRLKNLILKITIPSTFEASLLINCHYDSALGSPAASDDLVSCASMIEVARKFAQLDVAQFTGTKSVTIIFLFNGAEESALLASHSFITQHSWAKDIKVFINLEGSGGGGRVHLFQAGPDQGAVEILLDAYSSTFNHFANSFSEFLFASGMIPSDTDFRIFRDYGGISGLDMAYILDGYVYHTVNDVEARISDSCLALSGDNLFKLAKSVILDKRLQDITSNKKRSDSPLNLKADKYSPTNKRSFLTKLYALAIAVFLQISCILLILAFVLTNAWIIHYFGIRLSWYAFRHNLFGIYLLPCLLTLAVFFTTNYDDLSIKKFSRFFVELGWLCETGYYLFTYQLGYGPQV
ncbi:unnamed protein product [Protopolystoma xenopodis]|uniref:Peptidase M28 domain-containing protein n=1 Tax=Protopolystoma xenopodis TaxID=117903 RepID=A0A3S5BUS3_9PLAT|nr:unnamed protein product [Protopolystoma xenopodis]